MSTTEDATTAADPTTHDAAVEAHPARRSYRGRQVLAVVLVIAGIAWLPLDHDIEGPILFALDSTHGVTTADLLSVAMFLFARALFLSGVGPRRRRVPRSRRGSDDRTALSRPSGPRERRSWVRRWPSPGPARPGPSGPRPPGG